MPDKRQEVVLIGPVLPFRGGVAQHTTMLHRALAKQANLLTLSFLRQYPATFFPGDSDLDPAYVNYREAGVDYCIDSLNPFSWRRAAEKIEAFGAKRVIIPWWTVFWIFFLSYLTPALKRRGCRVTFFCHNIVDHEKAAWKQWLARRVLSLADDYVVHTAKDREKLLQMFPDARVTVHPHPIYDQFPPSGEALPRRAGLELLFYGFVRPYKGLDVLLSAMALLKDDDVMLTVAGEFWGGTEQYRRQIEQYGLRGKVELQPYYHNEQETADLFQRADFVVLPYRSASGSGIVPVAYHYNRPVVVTGVGGLRDVVREGATGLVVEPDSPQELAEALRKCADFELSEAALTELKQAMTWDSLAALLEESNP